MGAARGLVARLPAGLRRRRARGDDRRRRSTTASAPGRRGSTTRVELGASGLALGPVFASEHPRLRHRGPPAHRPPARRRRATSTRWSRRRTTAGCGCCWTGCSTTSAGTSRRSARCCEQGPAAPTATGSGCAGRTGRRPSRTTTTSRATRQLVALDHAAPGGGRLRRRGDDPLAGPRRRRLAAGRGVRGADGVLGQVLPRVRGRHPDACLVGEVIHGDYAAFVPDVAARLGHPVRAVEGDLELPERRATSTSWPARWTGTTGSWRRSCR